MSDDMLTWLRAQIEVRLAKAQAATQGVWMDDGSIWVGHHMNEIVEWVTCDEDLAHIMANQPSDAVARCEAELAILDLHAPRVPEDYERWGTSDCRACHDLTPCRTVRLLAYGYRNHPDYSEEWRL